MGILLGTTVDTISIELSQMGISQLTWSLALLSAAVYNNYSIKKMFATIYKVAVILVKSNSHSKW